MAKQDTTRDAPAHTPGTRKGEELKSKHEGKEPGEHEGSSSHAGRPSGHSTGRDSTSINPDDRTSKTGPHLRTP